MPVVEGQFQNARPLFHVGIGVSVPRQQALVAAGQSATCLDPAAIAPLQLVPTGSVQVQTPTTRGTPHTCSSFDVSLVLPAPAGPPMIIEALPILEAVLRPQGIDGLPGRDVLDRCTFIYNAPRGGFTLAF